MEALQDVLPKEEEGGEDEDEDHRAVSPQKSPHAITDGRRSREDGLALEMAAQVSGELRGGRVALVAMAREAGLNAWYREVEIEPEWNALDDTLLVSLHVNAATVDRGREYVIDVSRRRAREGERYRKISDREAEAQFYNNLGANALVAQDLPMAYAYFRKAEQTRPGLDYVWSNLGVVYRRNGQTEDAVLAYETALALNERNTVPLNNLYSIYDEDGETEKAAAIQQRVERNRSRNPYYLHYLAESAFAEHALDEAIDYANRAIRIEDREYRFYYTLAQLQYRTGHESRARLNLRKAIRLALAGAVIAAIHGDAGLPATSEVTI